MMCKAELINVAALTEPPVSRNFRSDNGPGVATGSGCPDMACRPTQVDDEQPTPLQGRDTILAGQAKHISESFPTLLHRHLPVPDSFLMGDKATYEEATPGAEHAACVHLYQVSRLQAKIDQ